MIEKDFRIDGDYVITSGIDWGYANGSRLKIIKKNEMLILARAKGQGNRFSLGSFGYLQPKYVFLAIKDNKILFDKYEEIEYSRKDMRKAKIKALSKFEEYSLSIQEESL